MPVPALGRLYEQGIDGIPYFYEILRALPWFATLYVLRKFFNGTQNANERVMHSRVAVITVPPP